MINKIFPRKLNSSSDSRLRKPDEMLDALNVTIKSDGNGDSGDVGVLKPTRSFRPLLNDNDFGGSGYKRAIGSVTDNKNNIIFFFVFSTAAEEQGVYAHDPGDVLGFGGSSPMVKIYTSSHFNFPENGFVKADVVYTSNHEFCNLYFTDNRNEPRRLDVKKALEADYTEAIDVKDFLTACPKTPMHPITFEFRYNSDSSISEFKNIQGFQFAYQCVYSGGEESAISTYSDIAVPPSYVQQGTIETPNLLAHNECLLTIPKNVNGVDVYSKEVEKIRILGRIGNDGSFYLIDEVDTTGNDIEYGFSNDQVLTGIPPEDQLKQFNSLPKRAEAQTAIDNRLFYGNYVEGFNEPEVNASLTVAYANRDADFINLQIGIEEIVLPSNDVNYDTDGIDYNDSYLINRKAGYKLSTENLPNSIEAGTVMTLNLTVQPDAAFKVYNTEDGGSHHLSKNILGRKDSYSRMDETTPGGEKILTERNSYGGTGAGVFGAMSWTPENSEELAVVCGTSASNALSIAGNTLNFSCIFEFNQEVSSNAKKILRNAICQVISGEDVSATEIGTSITVINAISTDSYSYNIGLNDEDGVGRIPVVGGDDYRKRLINAVLPVDAETNAPPVGYFIINSAEVSISINRNKNPEAMDDLGEFNGYLYLDLESLTNISTKNCVPVILSDYGQFISSSDLLVSTPGIYSWAVYSNSYANSEVLFPNILDVSDGAEETVNYNGVFDALSDPDFVPNEESPLFNSLILSESSIYGRLSGLGDLIDNVSLLDGEQGPDSLTFGSLETYIVNILTAQANTAFPIPSDLLNTSAGSVNYLNLFGDQRFLYFRENEDVETDDGRVIFKRVGVDLETAIDPDSSVRYRDAFDDDGESILEEKASQVEVKNFNNYLIGGSTTNYDRSFKTKANHDFGIVYYDERGRSGDVNKLGSVYVPGYSAEERGPQKGRSEIVVNLNYFAPEWAHHYQIVYAGNSSVNKFIQYTTGGAFVSNNEEDSDIGNIYVSLNYLQQHPTASYSKGFGAVSTEGLSDMYSFTAGDKLRIISYYTNEENRVWPNNFEFDIVDSVILTSDYDSNPLVSEDDEDSSTTVPSVKTGRFLVLKNSPYAVGFTHTDVKAQTQTDTNSHHWNDRCVVEISTPSDKQNAEDRVYYEIGKVYNVVKNDEVSVHQTNPIVLRNGDVWWRRVPVNMPDYDSGTNMFNNLITSNTSEPKFRDYYLESRTFNDTLPNADVLAWGKVKSITDLKKEVRRESSITYSDKNNYASSIVRFTSFNPIKFQFKDLPNEYGAINYILNYSDAVFCIQESKCSSVPVNRTILSDASGVETLIASKDILGVQRFFSGEYGCDNNPESVAKVGNFIYFASKVSGEVYRFSPENGITVISDIGMKQFFRSHFNYALAQTSQNVRISSGYDPLKDEYLISILSTSILTEPPPTVYEPPTLGVISETTSAVQDVTFEIAEAEPSVSFSTNSIVSADSNSVSYYSLVTLSNLGDDSYYIYPAVVNSDFSITSSTSLGDFVDEIPSDIVPPFNNNSILVNSDGSYIVNGSYSNLNPGAEYKFVFIVYKSGSDSWLGFIQLDFSTLSAISGTGTQDPVSSISGAGLTWVYNNIGVVGSIDIEASLYSNVTGQQYSYFVVDNGGSIDFNSLFNSGLNSLDVSNALNDSDQFNIVTSSENIELNSLVALDVNYPIGVNNTDLKQLVVFISNLSGGVVAHEIASLSGIGNTSNSPIPIIEQEGLDVDDYIAILSAVQEFNTDVYNIIAADINLDGIVGTSDLLTLLAQYGNTDTLGDAAAQAEEDSGGAVIPPGTDVNNNGTTEA